MSRFTNPVAPLSPLERLGRLYRDQHGFEVWAIHDLNGNLVMDGIESDFDAKFIASQVLCENQ